MNFPDLLKKSRIEKKMLKIDVANHFGWTPMYYGRYEKGDLKPTSSNIKKFSDFMGVSVTDLEKILKKEE